MATDYVSKDKVKMKITEGFKKGKTIELLWGDLLRDVVVNGNKATVKARGATGEISASALGGKPLLEFYFIDVGQGDGVLIKTPDNRHILIDGGYNRDKQPSGKNAADFVDWKFVRDYGMEEIELDAMIASHCDADHYGGLWDLLNPSEETKKELDAKAVKVENFYHAGIAWWKSAAQRRFLGGSFEKDQRRFVSKLMENRSDVLASLDSQANPKLQGEWAKFIETIKDAKRKSGSPTNIKRISKSTGFLPSFNTNDVANGKASFRVLAPIEYDIDGKPCLEYLHTSEGSRGNSQTTNGNSILLKCEYGRVKVLLTGDLNTSSQHAIMNDYEGKLKEFECDVAKGCHHGSDDVSYKFLSLMEAAVSIISSGDTEGHNHPRPSIVGASAVTGYKKIDPDKDALVTPLIYSTEIARSLGLGKPDKLKIFKGTADEKEISGTDLDKTELVTKSVKSGALRPSTITVRLNDSSRMVTDLVYGLVNVRTDGDKILCAVLNEGKYKWEIETIRSRFCKTNT